MDNKSKHLLTVSGLTIATLFVISLLGWGLTTDPNLAPDMMTGNQAPNFDSLLLQGDSDFGLTEAEIGSKLSLEHLRGRELVLNFWASWCVSCREEAIILENFWQQHRSEGVLVVGIAIQDSIEAAGAFAKHFGKTYILAVDDQGSVPINYGVTGVPETFFIRKDGTIHSKYAGPMTTEMLNQRLKDLRSS